MVTCNMNNSSDVSIYQNQPNTNFIHCQTCYKCNTLIYFNNEQFSKCISCNRLCCNTCMSTYSFRFSYYYQCEYCCMNVALQNTSC
jgi:hypothetical protein